MKNKIALVFLGMLTIFFLGCNTNFKNEIVFLKWIGQPKNGFVVHNSANGFNLSLKYLPSNYVAFLEYKKSEVDQQKSTAEIFEDFRGSMTFLLTIEHDESGVDATNYKVNDLPEYRQRMNELNFEIKNHLFIEGENGEKKYPVLATFENLYEVGGKKSFYIVFTKDSKNDNVASDIDVVFQDPYFDTGISHFKFDKKKINQLPELQFIKDNL